MKGAWATTRTYIELARLSNLPTCFSNVLVGCAIGLYSVRDPEAAALPLPIGAFGVLCLAISLMYVAGMAANDAFDAPFDQQFRPDRPIPSGRLTRRKALVFALVTGALGLGLVATLDPFPFGWCLLLVAAITVYTITHKRFAAAAVLMGVCRGLVYLLSAAAITREFDWVVGMACAGAMTAYISVLTLLARREHLPDVRVRRAMVIAMPVIILLPAFVPGLAAVPPIAGSSSAALALGAFAAILWTVRSGRYATRTPPRMREAVLGWLAGISLADAFFLALLDRPGLALGAVACFALTILGHRRILGT